MADDIAATSTPAPAASTAANGNVAEGAAPSGTSAPVAAPAESAPATVSTPAQQTTAEPSKPTETPASPDPAAEPKAEEAKPADAKAAEPALLSKEEKPQDTSGDKKPTEETKATEGQSDEPAQLPAYDPFTLPEGTDFDKERLDDFTKKLGEFENSKPDHSGFQKFGQSLVELHLAELENALTKQNESLVQSWNQRKTDWVKKFESDPELGGNRKETSLREAKEFIRTHGGSQEQIDAFYDALKETGADAHPEIVRFILNVKNSSTFRTPQPLAANKPAEQKQQSKVSKRYGSNT